MSQALVSCICGGIEKGWSDGFAVGADVYDCINQLDFSIKLSSLFALFKPVDGYIHSVVFIELMNLHIQNTLFFCAIVQLAGLDAHFETTYPQAMNAAKSAMRDLSRQKNEMPLDPDDQRLNHLIQYLKKVPDFLSLIYLINTGFKGAIHQIKIWLTPYFEEKPSQKFSLLTGDEIPNKQSNRMKLSKEDILACRIKAFSGAKVEMALDFRQACVTN